jgi:hypothetical protein
MICLLYFFVSTFARFIGYLLDIFPLNIRWNMHDAEQLLQHFQNGCTSVRNTSRIFQSFRQSMYGRAGAVLQWKANILSVCSRSNNNHYLLSLECRTTLLVSCCVISWTELSLQITFVWQMINPSCAVHDVEAAFATEVLLSYCCRERHGNCMFHCCIGTSSHSHRPI